MPPTDPVALGAMVVAAGFLLPVLFTVYIRNLERWQRNSWGSVFGAFFYGAIFSILIAVFLEAVFAVNFNREYNLPNQRFSVPFEVVLAVVAAPLVEEFTKGLGIRSQRRRIREPEDGIVYGAAVGLGFSATENVFYELGTLAEQYEASGAEGLNYAFLGVAGLRSITSSFLHATASGLLGYGMARRYLSGAMFLEVLPYYALAVLLHAAFNALAVFVAVGGVPLGGLALILLVSFGALRFTIKRVRELDARGQPLPYNR